MSKCGFANLTLLRGAALAAADLNGLSDPYCVVKFGARVVAKSRVIRETLDPVWDDAFVFFVADRSSDQGDLKVCLE
jgi:Ca2+-dependent lipid-binding protein